MTSRAKFTILTASSCLTALLLLGSFVGRGKAESSNDNIYRHLAVYTEVLSRIKSEYVEEPDMKSVTLGATNGLLESLDPFASYLNSDQYKEYLKNFDSYKGDLGMVLAKKFGYITIVSTVPGSPAAKAGLTTGDMIETIRGVATHDMPLAYAVLLLKGQPGSTVDLSVLRRRPDPQKLTLTRAEIIQPAVESKLMEGKVGYVKVASLSSGKGAEVGAAVAALETQGASRFILDLRNCAVGTPDEGIDLANVFLADGLITYAQGQKFARQDSKAVAKKQVTKAPLTVIINRGTASAAEVAAGALLNSKRAALVGERTYGFASIRQAVTMDDGSAVILSIAKYYTPDGKSIQDNGITPDNVLAEPDTGADVEDESDAAPEKPAETDSAASKKPAEDLLLKKALELVASR